MQYFQNWHWQLIGIVNPLVLVYSWQVMVNCYRKWRPGLSKWNISQTGKTLWVILLNRKYGISAIPTNQWSGSINNYRILFEHSDVYTCTLITQLLRAFANIESRKSFGVNIFYSLNIYKKDIHIEQKGLGITHDAIWPTMSSLMHLHSSTWFER